MAPTYYRARGYAADTRGAKVPVDYEAKAREADREFSGVEFVVRNGPPGPILTFLRSVPVSDDRVALAHCQKVRGV